MKERKLFYNGTIITMDKDNSIVEAVVVEDGIIVARGEEKLLRQKYKKLIEVDLKGNTLLPGFIEPHAHFDLCSMVSQMSSVSGIEFGTTENVLNQLKKIIKDTPKGKWIMCFGLDYLLNRDLPEMNRYYLDSLTKDHPLAIIIQSMHTVYCNSLALEKANITKDTKDTRDGHCYKDDKGEPIGVLTEQSFIIPFIKLWLDEKKFDPLKLLKEEAYRWKKLGITTTWTAGYFPLYPDHFNLMNKFFNLEDTPLRGDYSLSFNSVEKGQVKEGDLNVSKNPKAHFTGVKSWYDGSPYTGNMFMFDNYLENEIMQDRLFIKPDQCGERLFDKEFFYNMLKKYHDQGYQLSVHAQGNRACHEVIEIFERILKESPRKDHRHRMEHCAFIDRKDLKKAADLGITISFHVNHLYYYGEALNELVIGEKLTHDALPCKSALKYGMKISLHSDAPMYSPNALRVVYGAITRKTQKGLTINEDETLTLTEALKAITIDAAYQLFRESEIGSIEIGKYADFTLINQNPYEIDTELIKDIKVITTYLAGKDTDLMI